MLNSVYQYNFFSRLTLDYPYNVKHSSCCTNRLWSKQYKFEDAKPCEILLFTKSFANLSLFKNFKFLEQELEVWRLVWLSPPFTSASSADNQSTKIMVQHHNIVKISDPAPDCLGEIWMRNNFTRRTDFNLGYNGSQYL